MTPRYNSINTKLSLEILEDRYVPSAMSFENLTSLHSITFTGRGSTERWQALAETRVELSNDISRFGLMTPLSVQSNQLTVFQASDGPVTVTGMSRRDGWVVGYTQNKAYLWNAKAPTQPRTLAVTDASGFLQSLPASVNSTGNVVGDTTIDNRQVPAFWSAFSGLQAVTVPEGFFGSATRINESGNLAAGKVFAPVSGKAIAAVFSRTGSTQLLSHAGYQHSEATALNNDGSLIAGIVVTPAQDVDGEYISAYTSASIWDADGQHTLLWSDGSEVKVPDYQGRFFLTADGYLAGNSLQGSFIWHPTFDGVHSAFLGAQPLGEWYEAVTGETLDISINYVSDLTRSSTGVLYIAMAGSDDNTHLLTVGGEPALPAIPQVNLVGTSSTDYFYISEPGHSQISINAGSGADFVEIVSSDESQVHVNLNLGTGDDQVHLRAQGIYDIQLGAGDDYLYAFYGYDDDSISDLVMNVTGGSGNDTLALGKAVVRAYLGDGNDRVVSNVLGDNSWIDTGAGSDTVSIERMSSGSIRTGPGNDYLELPSALHSNIKTGSGRDIVIYSGWGSSIFTEGGHDRVELSTGYDLQPTWVYLGDGNDSLFMTGDAVNIWGGAGNDQIDMYHGSNIRVRTETGNDRVSSFGTRAFVDLGDGDDAYENSEFGSQDIVLGGRGNDIFRLLGGNTTAFGEAGSDGFFTTGGLQIISGGSGVDRLLSEGGTSAIDLGSDTFNLIRLLSTDQLVERANNFFTRSNLSYLPLSRRSYLELIAPALQDLKFQRFRLPSSY